MMDNSNFLLMIVDKDKAIRERLGKRLSDEGYTVEMMSSAELALERIEEKGELPHVIFSEVQMGGMSGIEFLSKVKMMNEDVEVVMMSGYATAQSAIESVRLGAYDYLNKDEFDNIDMVATVCNRAIEKLRIKFQNINLINQLKEQNIEMQKNAKELEQKKDQLNKLNKSIMRSQLESEQRLILSNTLFPITDPKMVMQRACELLISFRENYYYLVLVIDNESSALIGYASSPPNYLNEDIKFDLITDTEPKKMKSFLDHISTNTDFIDFIKKNYKTDNFMTHPLVFK